MNPEQKVVRRRRTRAEIKQLVAEFLSSGMERGEFCRSHGLSWDTLNRNLKKHGRSQDAARSASRLMRVKFVSKRNARNGDSARLAVILGGGRKIEVGVGFDTPTLEQLVQVLEQV
ncbi:MAG TPA: hypothetical protein VKY85_05455 [Candidatus Angelobacter sp.]|jgi:hypothetical protein|nr:hypothetical protein [Candidatus Angelobacter sp.]HLJ26135.1 hypothetical protein [Candidatus Angelobacter sp.]